MEEDMKENEQKSDIIGEISLLIFPMKWQQIFPTD